MKRGDGITSEKTKTTKKRAVIYARYSTAGQKDISVEDQITLCRKHAERDDSINITTCPTVRRVARAPSIATS